MSELVTLGTGYDKPISMSLEEFTEWLTKLACAMYGISPEDLKE